MYELMNGNLNAANMTNLLCKLGDGDMQEGIRNVFVEGLKCDKVKHILTGAGIGAGVVATVVLCCWGVKKYRAKKLRQRAEQRSTTNSEKIVFEEVEVTESINEEI